MRSRIVALSASLLLGAAFMAPAAAANAEPSVADAVAAATLPPSECKLASPLPFFNEGFQLSPDAADPTDTLTVQVIYAEFPDHAAGDPDDRPLERIQAETAEAVENLETLSGNRLDVVIREHPDRVMLPNSFKDYPADATMAWYGETQARFLTDAIDAADPVVDFSGADVVWVFFPWIYPLPERAQATNALDVEADGGVVTRAVTMPTVNDGPLAPTIVHETGHTFSLPDLYDTEAERPVSSYFGRWDPMSAGGNEALELVGWHLWRLGWIDDDQVTCIAPSSSLELEIDALSHRGDSVVAVIPTSDHRAVVLESRRADRFDSWITRPGVLVYIVWTDSALGPILVGPRDGSEFPSDAQEFDETALMVGDRYTDPIVGYTVTVIASTEDSDTVRIAPPASPDPTPGPVAPGDEPDHSAGAQASPMLPPTGPSMDPALLLLATIIAGIAGVALISSSSSRRRTKERKPQ